MKNNYLYHPDKAVIENVSGCKKDMHNIAWYFRNGVPVVEIDPAYIGQEWPVCHNTDRNTRYARDDFRCLNCGHSGEADYAASWNIRQGRSKSIHRGRNYL